MKPDLLSRFMEVTDSNQGDYSANDKYLRDIIINFIIAGRDTTATTLSWFFHMLSKSPDVEKKILREIRELVKEKERVPLEETVTRFCESLTHTALDKMHYLHAALSEALRLYPPIAQVKGLELYPYCTVKGLSLYFIEISIANLYPSNF